MNGFVYTKRGGVPPQEPGLPIANELNTSQQVTSSDSLGSNIERILTGLGASAASSLGTTASLGQMGLGLLGKGYEKITGQPGPLPERLSIPYKYLGPTGELLQAGMGALGYPSANLTPPTIEEIRGKIAEQLPTGYLEPRGTAEEVAQSIAGGIIPTVAGGGTAAIPALLGTVTGEQLAKKLGMGPGWQIGFGLLGGGLAGARKLPATGAKALELATERREKLYKIADQAQKGINVNAETIGIGLNELMESGIRTLRGPIRKEVGNTIKDALDILGMTKGNVAVGKARDAKKLLNSAIHEATKGEGFWEKISPANLQKIDAYKRGVGIINNEIQRVAESNPKFGIPYSTAEELTVAMKARTKLPLLFEKLGGDRALTLIPLTKAILSGEFGSIPGKLAEGLGMAALSKTGQSLTKAFNIYKRSPELRSMLKDLAISAAEENAPAFANQLTKINDFAKQQEPENNFVFTKHGK